ncbi:hypothetical protein DFA_04443 [Cavenderia fasciculata]|uniref:Uncharacterized protein n=1 Tax=Cavenderia fasciculata TaxID=261658 RepID=F4PPL2_CACFS|nr:uncharacterized protein DFA_04443 [Cavenderia fasciculata]EGG22325.1 hypothetical protein DFA_04443 [Cavenderia fasciculata]|eukprot:XP_004360176.1 hypothetical protein DFA_04443 [Cavenderia fasciculata]
MYMFQNFVNYLKGQDNSSNNNNSNDDDQDEETEELDLTLSLPWPIIEKIIRLAFIGYNVCTCIHHKEMKDMFLQSRSLATGSMYYSALTMQPMLQHWALKRDDMCSLHRYYHDKGNVPAFIFTRLQLTGGGGHLARGKSIGMGWRLSLALVSRKMFALVSREYIYSSDIVFYLDLWRVYNLKYGLSKRPSIITINHFEFGGGGVGNIDKSITSHLSILQHANELIVDGGRESTINLVISQIPYLSKLTVRCNLEPTMSQWISQLKHLTTVDFVNFPQHQRVERFLKELNPLKCHPTKIYVPYKLDFNWNSLHGDIKRRLVGITYTKDSAELVQGDFPRLRHINVKKAKGHLPTSPANKIKTKQWIRKDFVLSKNYKSITINVMFLDSLSKILDYNYQATNLSTIKIYTDNVIYDNDIIKMNQMGYIYKGSISSIKKKRNKIKFIKSNQTNQSQNQINQNHVNQNNNQNNQINNQINNNIYNNIIILPNIILYKIIMMVWKSREFCTCMVDQNWKNRWDKEQHGLFNNQILIDQYCKIKENCPVHFSSVTPYQPLTVDKEMMNHSRLQLSLINKDIWSFIANRLFMSFDLSRLTLDDIIKRQRNPCSLAFKCIRSVSITNSLLDMEITEHLKTVTKLHLEITDSSALGVYVLDRFPNLSSLVLSRNAYFRESPIDTVLISKCQSLTNLTVIGWGRSEFNAEPLEQLKGLRKLILSNDQWYDQLSPSFRRQITSTMMDDVSSLVTQFPNIQQIQFPIQQIKLKSTITRTTIIMTIDQAKKHPFPLLFELLSSILKMDRLDLDIRVQLPHARISRFEELMALANHLDLQIIGSKMGKSKNTSLIFLKRTTK